MNHQARCPLCSTPTSEVLFHLRNSPVLQNKLLPTSEEAVAVSRKDITYYHCDRCHFAFNPAFDRARVDYRGYYNNQTESAIYRQGLEALANRLAVLCELGPESTILEIGAGNGYFLSRLKAITGSRSVHGFDPAYRGEHGMEAHIQRRYFDAVDLGPAIDLLVVRHCLEGLTEADSVRQLFRAMNDRSRMYVEITDLDHILEERNPSLLFQEYYRYFSARSIDIALRRAGFRVMEIFSPLGSGALGVTASRAPIAPALRDAYRSLEQAVRRHRRVVIWGISGRAISLLAHMSWDKNVVAYGVDIDPARQGMFVPVTGQEILSPEQAKRFEPDLVIVANEMYAPEVRTLIGESIALVNLRGDRL
ncbi:MAG TPA: methyltransferase domain-containing protein [Polyangia bacterium]|nr:methyltransferase domain-containing protein [Polyangia bacterium]